MPVKDERGSDSIGRLLIMEFADDENSRFDEIMDVLKKYSDFNKYEIQNESKLSLFGLEIYPGRRKIYCDLQEIHLTVKEFDLLCLLAINKGYVLTYEQIYERIWKNISSGDEKATVRFHIYNLRKKLYKVNSEPLYTIRCVREVGYCLEVNQKRDEDSLMK